MTEVKPVIVGTDGSDHARLAVRWAAHHAHLHGAPLLIVTAVSAPVAYGMGGNLPQEFFTALEEDGARILREATAEAHDVASGLEVESVVKLEATGPALLALSERGRTIVVGTRGLSGLASAFMGSISSLVARHAACPVVVVRSEDDQAPAPVSGPVVVGVDGSENSAKAVATAVREASARGATLVAVHAWSDVPLSTMDPIAQVRGLFDEAAVADAVLSEQLAGYSDDNPDLNIEHVVVLDRPDTAILDHAEGAQLVVVGSRGRGGFAGLMLGSTSIKVLRSARCPVMVVHS
ncbi:universal stress protein [Tomitella fengzijianii]|uniref:Universal stress protein n=1 Tax=Tomitella fengzijianii TaxID=2597660 RepID=A0A516X2T7_9ACTN|nr:universal stress protein [Tomitella fengzijianii]QDQ97365.1 universal stress protein [Tomitella fengzijianii]